MKSSFPKRVKRHSQKLAYDTNTKFRDYPLEKSFSHLYICIYLLRDLFQNMISKLGIGVANSIFELAFNAFLEKSSSYVFATVQLQCCCSSVSSTPSVACLSSSEELRLVCCSHPAGQSSLHASVIILWYSAS